MEGLSVVTITYNEEKNIKNFIESHNKLANEIIVIDSGSTDNTVKIAKEMGAIVIYNKWDGYAKQWNFGIKRCTYDWIVIGDADHVITKQLANEINIIITNKKNEYDAYYMPRKNIMFGKWVKHGGFYPDIPYARMFKNGKGLFDEEQTIHEKLKVDSNKIGKLNGDILHYTYFDFNSYIEKLNKYTELEALSKIQNKSTVKSSSNRIIDKNKIKSKIPFRTFLMFVYRYIFKLGILDGKVGFIMAFSSAFYEFAINVKVWQKNATKTDI